MRRTRRAFEYVGVTLVALLVLLFAAIGAEYSLRGSPLSYVATFTKGDGAPAIGDTLFTRTMSLYTKTPLDPGNSIEVLANGDATYARLWADLRSARRSITLQLYYMKPGRMADTLSRILVDRARAGVRVLLLRDAFGSQNLTTGWLDTLRQAGVEIASFRPVRWYQLRKAQNRSHIRVVIVDGVVGYTGGFGIDDKWFGDGHTDDEWRDTNVRFTGPAVSQLQATFGSGWVEATGELLTGDLFFPAATLPEPGGALAGMLHAAPTAGSTAAERYLALSIAGAQHRLWITNSYFVPDDDFRKLLIAAARRGVDVRVLTAGDNSDVAVTLWAARHWYGELLRGGVKIYEYQPTMMHAKTLVVDDRWSSIGTMNFDNRSMVFNDESNLLALDHGVAATMNSLFTDDLRYSKEIALPQWEQRSWFQRVRETLAAGLDRLL